MLSRMLKSVVAIAGFVMIQGGMPAAADAYSPTGAEAISSNQPEYTLGDTAVIYGVGFAPGASVIIEVVRSDGSVVTGNGTNTPGSDTVMADGMGAFTYWYIVEGPPEAYASTVTANARPVDSPGTVLASTTFIDGTQYLLQGCSKDRGDCTFDGAASGWAGGTSPMTGWTAGNLKGWFEGDNVPYRLRVGLRDYSSGGTTVYVANEHDNLRSGVLGIDRANNFYVGAGPDASVTPEGKLTKSCTDKTVLAPSDPSRWRLVTDPPLAGCIVTGPNYTETDDDGDGRIDEEIVNGIDDDADGRIDEDPARQSGSTSVKRIQYAWAVPFTSSETGSSSKKWALYWTAHLAAGANNWSGSSLHAHTTKTGSSDVPITNCSGSTGSGADLSITKTDSPDPVFAGQSLTYTITVSNAGPNTATGVTVSDTLPTTVTFASATSTVGTCSMSGGVVTCSIGTLAVGASATVTIVVTPFADGTLSNTAIVSSATSDPTPSNNTAGPVNTTVSPSANLSIIKSDSPDPVLAGQNLTYNITVNNAGPSSATGVTVTDTLSPNVTLVSATPSQGTCSGTATITCAIGTLANGASATITIVVTPSAAAVGTLSNTATVSSAVNDPASGNNSSTTTTTVNPAANLSITKSDSPDPVLAGQNLTYSITVTNNGPSAATGVSVSDTLPANVTLVSATPSQGTCSGTATITCAIGTLANGASATITIVVTPSAAAVGTLTNTASVSGNEADTNTGNNSWTTTTTVDPAANLSITKTDNPDPVLVGSNLTYTITVTNNGPSSATGVSVTDTLPGGVNWVSSTPSQGSCSGTSTVTCSLGTLTNGASATVTIVVTPAVANPSLSNTASVTSGVTDPNTGNNSATTSTTVNGLSADLALNKTDSPDPVLIGQNLTYTITVTNLGPNSATGVSVSDSLPAGVTYVSATPSQGSCSGTSTVICSIGILGNGASATVTIVVTPTAAGTLNNTASVTSGVTDPAPGNNSASTSTTVNAQADLSITKSDSPDPVLVGQNLTYTITVTNNGPNTATGVVMTDPLPAGVTFVSSSSTLGSCTGTTTVSCTIGTLTNGASAVVTIVVTPTVAGTLTNTASVTSSVTDPNSANNSAPGTTTVNAQADLSITKTDSPDPVVVGGTLTYTITVTNNGPNGATGATVTDTLPAGVTFVSATPSQGSCSGTATVTCSLGAISYPGSATVTIVVTPTATGTLSNTASVSSTTTDPNSSNNTTGPVTTLVNPASVLTDLAVTQVANPSSPQVGTQVTFTITITNNGPGTATGVTLTDTLPTPATFNSVTPNQGTCNAPSGGIFTCNLGTIPNGGSVVVTLVVTTSTQQGLIANTAAVSGNEAESTVVNNSALESANVGDVSRLINISTRGYVGTNGDIMVGGFILGGNVPKQLLVRGIGPTLSSFGVSGAMANPTIELLGDTDNNPSTPQVLIATNNDWQNQTGLCNAPAVCGTVQDIINTNMSANTYAPTNPNRALDSALLVTLPPGAYTVRMFGVNNGTGVGLFGVDDPDGTTLPKLVNVSTRGRVQSTIPLVGGFIIGAGTGSKTILVRGFGPSLTSFGLTGVLANPTIELFSDTDSNPITPAVLIATNNDWQNQTGTCNAPAVCGTAQDIFNTGLSADTYAPTNPNRALDSALLVTLPPGAYTLRITGVGSTSGVALVGIDELGQ